MEERACAEGIWDQDSNMYMCSAASTQQQVVIMLHSCLDMILVSQEDTVDTAANLVTACSHGQGFSGFLDKL